MHLVLNKGDFYRSLTVFAMSHILERKAFVLVILGRWHLSNIKIAKNATGFPNFHVTGRFMGVLDSEHDTRHD